MTNPVPPHSAPDDARAWREIEDAFDRIVNLPGEEQSSALAAITAARTREEVKELLDAHGRAPETMATPAVADPRWTPWLHEETEATGLAPGTELGPYRIESELGRGGDGVVYLATDTETAGLVALKLLWADFAQAAQTRKFRQESQLLERIRHPNIARLHAIVQEEDLSFLVLEYLEGPGLKEEIQDNPVALERALALTRDVCLGLAAAHRVGVIHADLKPSNVRLDRNGVAKILDFGLATSAADAKRPLHRPPRGSAGYASPEQLRGEPFDARVDLWALGCLVFECLSGVPAFGGHDADDAVQATLDREPNWGHLEHATPPLVELVKGLLQKDPEKRVRSVDEVLQVLEQEFPESLPRARSSRCSSEFESSLPLRLTTFVGQADTLRAVEEALVRNRLVTVTGSPGIGKTRLALELATARSSTEQIHWVDVTRLSDASELWHAILSSTSLMEQPQQTPEQSLVRALATRRSLLVFDSCEQVRTPVSNVASTLLDNTRDLRILVTSREPLGISGEVVHEVRRLEVHRTEPGTIDETIEAISLFLDRAQAVVPKFWITRQNYASVVSICQCLDGLPLAIELAAAQLALFAVEEIRDRVAQDVALTTADRSPDSLGHSFIERLLEASLAGLTESEQSTFVTLSVFECAFSCAAASEICTTGPLGDGRMQELLDRLVARSLIQCQRGAEGTVEYALLGIVRAFCRTRLTADDRRIVLDRHRRHFLTEAETLSRADAAGGSFARFAHQWRDISKALEPHEALMRQQLRTASALGNYWRSSGLWAEGRFVSDRLLEAHRDNATDAFEALRCCAAELALMQRDLSAAHRYLGSSDTLLDDQVVSVRALCLHAQCKRAAADLAGAAELGERALAVADKSQKWQDRALALMDAGRTAQMRGRMARALELYESAYRLYHDLEEPRGIAQAAHLLGTYWCCRAQPDKGLPYLEELQDYCDMAGDAYGLGEVLLPRAAALMQAREDQKAQVLYERAVELYTRVGSVDRRLWCQLYLADITWNNGGRAAGKRAFTALRDECQALRIGPGQAGVYGTCLNRLAEIAFLDEEYDAAHMLAQEGLERAATPVHVAWALLTQGLALQVTAPSAAATALEDAWQRFTRMNSPEGLGEVVRRRACLFARHARLEAAAALFGYGSTLGGVGRQIDITRHQDAIQQAVADGLGTELFRRAFDVGLEPDFDPFQYRLDST